MDLAVILTYRCNSRCAMCWIWQHPTVPAEEIGLDTLARLPGRFGVLHLTGGEPTLRRDLPEIVDLLRPKARRLEISTNGLRADALETIVRRHPDIRIRISLEGIGARNDTLRGERNGFERKRETLRRLAEAGARDLGIAMVVQDENADQVPLLQKAGRRMSGGLDIAALHNGFQFHKMDNEPANRLRTARSLQPLMLEHLLSNQPARWLRAYQDLGLLNKILGRPRRLRCRAGTDFLWLDPWGRVYACNIRPDLEIGDLTQSEWRHLLHSPRALEVRTKVRRCTHNCWMAGQAKTALRHGAHGPPRLAALRWALVNAIRARMGLPMNFDREVDFADVASSAVAARRTTWLGKPFRPAHQYRREAPYGAYNNVMNK